MGLSGLFFRRLRWRRGGGWALSPSLSAPAARGGRGRVSGFFRPPIVRDCIGSSASEHPPRVCDRWDYRGRILRFFGVFFFFSCGEKRLPHPPGDAPQHGRSPQSPIAPAGSGGRAGGLWVSGLAVPKPWGALGRAVPLLPFPLPRLGLWPVGAGRLRFVLCKRMLMAGPAMRWLRGIKMPAVLLPPLFLLLLPPPSPGSKMAAAGKCGVDRNERQRKQRWQEAAAARGALCCAWEGSFPAPARPKLGSDRGGGGSPVLGSSARLSAAPSCASGLSRSACSERRDWT